MTQFFRDPEAFDALTAMAIMPCLNAKGKDEPDPRVGAGLLDR